MIPKAPASESFTPVEDFPTYSQFLNTNLPPCILFMTDHTPPYSSSLYNNDGKSRGFPDVSANGANYVIAIGGKFATVYGTSASSPVFASMISLINDARLAQGKNSVGFINPTLYSDKFTSAFNDITTGGNPGCGLTFLISFIVGLTLFPVLGTKGFNATIGWDPVTGLGTPKFRELLAQFLSLP